MAAQEDTGEWTPVLVDFVGAVGGTEWSARPARWPAFSFSHFPGVCVKDLQQKASYGLFGRFSSLAPVRARTRGG